MEQVIKSSLLGIEMSQEVSYFNRRIPTILLQYSYHPGLGTSCGLLHILYNRKYDVDIPISSPTPDVIL